MDIKSAEIPINVVAKARKYTPHKRTEIGVLPRYGAVVDSLNELSTLENLESDIVLALSGIAIAQRVNTLSSIEKKELTGTIYVSASKSHLVGKPPYVDIYPFGVPMLYERVAPQRIDEELIKALQGYRSRFKLYQRPPLGERVANSVHELKEILRNLP